MHWNEIVCKSHNVLLVENSRGRIIASSNALGSRLADIAITESGLKGCLQSENFNTLWLDYDLTRIWHIGHRETSYNVLKEYKGVIVASGIRLVVVHSWNIFGAKKLAKLFDGTRIEVIVKRHWRII